MPKVIVTAQVEDGVQWEVAFRTHGDLLGTYGLKAPVEFSVVGNDVALFMDATDVDKLMQAMESPETVAAMAFDGVKRESVKMFVLDKSV
jgi:hypothetical protein